MMKLPIAAAALAGLASLSAPSVQAQDSGISEAARIAHGGQIYDKWWKALKTAEPTETHPAYPSDAAQTGSATWRCKECHGWDYIGAEGRYSSGSHFSGIAGISGAAGADPTAIASMLRGEPHNYTADMIDDAGMADLALFVSKGQYDATKYIVDGKPVGDAANGQSVYQTVCAGCHGIDGMKIKEMPPMGELSGNPQEMMHKILYGQPAEAMPAMYVFGPQVAADIAAYAATLPK